MSRFQYESLIYQLKEKHLFEQFFPNDSMEIDEGGGINEAKAMGILEEY